MVADDDLTHFLCWDFFSSFPLLNILTLQNAVIIFIQMPLLHWLERHFFFFDLHYFLIRAILLVPDYTGFILCLHLDRFISVTQRGFSPVRGVPQPRFEPRWGLDKNRCPRSFPRLQKQTWVWVSNGCSVHLDKIKWMYPHQTLQVVREHNTSS